MRLLTTKRAAILDRTTVIIQILIMLSKTRGLDRNVWILIIAFVPNFLSTANGTLINRHNVAARDALDPYLHALAICALVILVIIGIRRYRRNE